MTSLETNLEVPFGIGKLTKARALWAALLLIGIGIGLWSFYQQEHHGEVVTNLRTIGGGGVTWGLYIVFVIVFIGISFAGVTVASLIRLFGLQPLKPLARMAELLTIVALIAGAMCVLADLGRPLVGLLNLPKYARPTSPFFGTFTMVIGGYLFASLVYFFLAGRSDAALMAKKNTPLRPLYLLWA
ncbi:MAG: putative anaerobic dehydrogenase rane anchor subunit, partial [Myxococcaceae bacterium]|nr:putative anaerobic dehydrogenase rane anchor subunit [Myxococcaceae bacterium]